MESAQKTVAKLVPLGIYCIVFVGFIIIITTSYRDYKYFRDHREEIYSADAEYIKNNCNDTSMAKQLTQEECHDRVHRHGQKPSEYAIYDVIDTWNLCGENGCIGRSPSRKEPGIFSISSMTELIGTIIVLLFVALLGIGVCLCSRAIGAMSVNVLPTYGSSPIVSYYDRKKID